MELNRYGIIRKFVVSSKSWRTFKELGKVTFEVDRGANRSMIREAVEKIWNVRVEKVCVHNRPVKTGVSARRKYTRLGQKHAIITLKPGYKIDLPGESLAHEAMAQDASKEGGE
jgi:large subunit ribosomal protein L23